MTTVSLHLPDDVARRLQRLAERTGRSQASGLVEAIQEYLDDAYIAE